MSRSWTRSRKHSVQMRRAIHPAPQPSSADSATAVSPYGTACRSAVRATNRSNPDLRMSISRTAAASTCPSRIRNVSAVKRPTGTRAGIVKPRAVEDAVGHRHRVRVLEIQPAAALQFDEAAGEPVLHRGRGVRCGRKLQAAQPQFVDRARPVVDQPPDRPRRRDRVETGRGSVAQPVGIDPDSGDLAASRAPGSTGSAPLRPRRYRPVIRPRAGDRRDTGSRRTAASPRR